MVIILILILQLISTALWLLSSGLVVQRRITNRLNKIADRVSDGIDEKVDQEKDTAKVKKASDVVRSVGTKALNTANRVSVVLLRNIRFVVNFLKGCLIAFLPVVLVLDLIILVIVSVVGSSVIFLLGGTGG